MKIQKIIFSFLGFILVLFFVALTAQADEGPKYTVVPITPSVEIDGSNFFPNLKDLNNEGQVLSTLGSSSQSSFLWQEGTEDQVLENIINGVRINDLGVIISYTWSLFPPIAQVWTPSEFGYVPETLFIADSLEPILYSINNLSEVVGRLKYLGIGDFPVLWTPPYDGEPIFLPTIYDSNHPKDINDAGHIVGVGRDSNYDYHAIRWDNDLNPRLLPKLPIDTESDAIAINENGMVVGKSCYTCNGNCTQCQAVRWDSNDVVYNLPEPIPHHPDVSMDTSESIDINDQGQILIKQRFDCDGGFENDSSPALFDGKNTYLLERTTNPGSGYQIWWAYGINNQGEVLAAASHPSYSGIRPVLLKPVEELCEGDLNMDGMVNTQDLLILLSRWGANCTGNFLKCRPCYGDITGDLQVGISDYLNLMGNWGSCN